MHKKWLEHGKKKNGRIGKDKMGIVCGGGWIFDPMWFSFLSFQPLQPPFTYLCRHSHYNSEAHPSLLWRPFPSCAACMFHMRQSFYQHLEEGGFCRGQITLCYQIRKACFSFLITSSFFPLLIVCFCLHYPFLSYNICASHTRLQGIDVISFAAFVSLFSAFHSMFFPLLIYVPQGSRQEGQKGNF